MIFDSGFENEGENKEEKQEKEVSWIVNFLSHLFVATFLLALILAYLGLYLEALLPPQGYHDFLFSDIGTIVLLIIKRYIPIIIKITPIPIKKYCFFLFIYLFILEV